MSNKRVALGKSARFRVFARDNFTCRYCGRTSDEAKLEIDHLIPVCEGGTNDDANLVTACFDCNRGKAGIKIEKAAPTEQDRLRLAQEAREQVEAAKAAAEAARARGEIQQTLVNYFCNVRGTNKMNAQTMKVLVSYVHELGCDLVFKWIDRAVLVISEDAPDSVVGRYVSGCRKHHMQELEKENKNA